MKPTHFFTIVTICAFVWPSCDVAVTSDQETMRVEDLLMSGEWQMTNLKIDGNSVWVDVDSCLKDNIEVYKANGQAETHNGSLRCDTSEASVETWDWGLLDEGKKLWWGNQGDNDTGTIDVLNTTSLHITHFVKSADQGTTEFFVQYTNVK